MLRSMSSYFTPPMCFCVTCDAPSVIVTTSAYASPPSADLTKPHVTPSRLSAKLPAANVRVPAMSFPLGRAAALRPGAYFTVKWPNIADSCGGQ